MLIYESNPDCPDPADVARVTDYIVAYACKGVESLAEERQQTISLVLAAEEESFGKQDVQRLARKVLNRSVGEKLVSKQEAMVQLGKLDLFVCSEMISTVSLSGYYKIATSGEGAHTCLVKYAKRDTSTPRSLELSLYAYFLENEGYSQKHHRHIVPHFTGASSTPVYPPTKDYARAVLLTHQPWHRKFDADDRDFLVEFWNFIKSPHCPPIVLIPFYQVYVRYLSKNVYTEPTSNAEGISYEEFAQDIPEDVALTVKLVSNIAGSAVESDGYEFDYGLEHNWTQPTVRIPGMDALMVSQWLTERLSESNSIDGTPGRHLSIPKKNDGRTYELQGLNKDQKEIAHYVLQGVKDWVECSRNGNSLEYKPIRLTVRGVAGSGKSTLIHTLSTAVKRLFDCDSSVCINGPTGCCAHSVGGKTLHSAWLISTFNQCMTLSADKMKKLLQRYANLVLLMVDERSMVSSSTLACLESYARQTVHKGRNNNDPWGSIPVVVFFGDDGQLPPIEKGAFYAFDNTVTTQSTNRLELKHRGDLIFKALAKDVMELKTIVRQDKNEVRLHRILRGLRAESADDMLSDADIDFLHSLVLHPDNERFTSEERMRIEESSTWLFANKAPRDHRNLKKMYDLHSATNPVARIVAKPQSKRVIASHFGEDSAQRALRTCIDCRVSICARNINPDWGLFNGSIGTVKDIVFASGTSPNAKDVPLYVLVDFDQYSGPRFNQSLPKTYVPVVPAIIGCTKNCCRMLQIPLRVAFAKTIHTFQGANVGPTKPGEPRNPIMSIIVDPGTKAFEGNNPGLFYTLLSRVTMLGTESDLMSSAIFFSGKNMVPERVKNITTDKQGKKYKKVVRRERWVDYLSMYTHRHTTSLEEQDQLFDWVVRTRITGQALEAVIIAMARRSRAKNMP
jgi:hypothetical protein